MARFLNLLPWRRRRLEQDLERELRYHIDRRVDDLRQSGVSDAEARQRVAVEFAQRPVGRPTNLGTSWTYRCSSPARRATS